MSSQFQSHQLEQVMPADQWAATDDFKRVAAYVATLPNAELMADALGLNLRPVRGSSSR